VSNSDEKDKDDMRGAAPLSASESESYGSDIDSDATPSELRQVCMRFLYLYGKACLSLRPYDAMHEVENSFPGGSGGRRNGGSDRSGASFPPKKRSIMIPQINKLSLRKYGRHRGDLPTH